MLPVYDVVVIHLPRRRDRMQMLEKNWGRIPFLRLHVMEAIDRKNLKTVRARGADLTGWKACYLSHEKALQQASAFDLPIVFEDDCCLVHPSEAHKLKELLDWCHDHRFDQWDVMKPDLNFFNEKNMCPGMVTQEIPANLSGKLFRVHNSLSTTCIIYSKQFASFLEGKPWTFYDRAIDDALNGNCRVLTHFPRLLCQPDGQSDVVKGVRKSDHQFLAAQKKLAEAKIPTHDPTLADLLPAVMKFFTEAGWNPEKGHFSVRIVGHPPDLPIHLKLYRVLSEHPDLRVLLCAQTYANNFSEDLKYTVIFLGPGRLTLDNHPLPFAKLKTLLRL